MITASEHLSLRAEIALVGRFVGSISGVWRYLFTINLIGAVSTLLHFAVPVLSAYFIDRITTAPGGHILAILGCLAAISLASLGLSIWESQLSCSFRERSSVVLQMKLLRRTSRLPHVKLVAIDPGTLMARITSDSGSAMEILAPLCSLGRMVTSTVCGLYLLPYFSTSLGITVLAVLVVYLAVVVKLRTRTSAAFREVSEKTARSGRELFEALIGVTTAKLFSVDGLRARRYVHAAAQRSRALVRARLVMVTGASVGQVIILGVSTTILVYGSFEIQAGRLTLGSLVGLTTTLGYLLGPLNHSAQQMISVQSAITGIQRVVEWITLEDEHASAPSAVVATARPEQQAPVVPAVHVAKPPLLEFVDLAYSYPDRPPVFRNVNVSLRESETILLSGPSGAGKTTLLHLLPRLLHPSHGAILLDGFNMNSLSVKSLREQIAFVSQDTFLFSESIAENIRIGRPGASQAEIEQAATIANAKEFINKTPDGFNTLVGPRGMTLSGGQRQRIAIARALLRPSRLLVLDEATAGVDADAADMIYDALKTLISRQTTIVVSHHWRDYVRRVDRVLTLRDKCLFEESLDCTGQRLATG